MKIIYFSYCFALKKMSLTVELFELKICYSIVNDKLNEYKL